MTRALFQQSLEDVFEASVGPRGMAANRFEAYADKARTLIPALGKSPVRECAPIFAMPARTDDLDEIEAIANEYANGYEALVVAGMGGSSFGGAFLAHYLPPFVAQSCWASDRAGFAGDWWHYHPGSFPLLFGFRCAPTNPILGGNSR